MSILDLCEFYCINLDTRTDRWESIQREFKKLPVKKELRRKSAVTDVTIINSSLSKGEHSLIQTNIQLLESNRNKCICIFEDDAIFLDSINIKSVIDLVTDQLPKTFEMLYLGAHLFDKKIKHPLISKNLVHLLPEPNPTPEKDHVFIGGAHAILFTPQIIEYILSLSPDQLYENQWDIFISKYVVPRFNTYMVYPPFAFQKEDYSDLENKKTERNWIISHNEKRILKGKYSTNLFVRVWYNLIHYFK